MSKKKISEKERKELRSVFLKRNIKAMKFCIENGFTVYASSQKNGKVKIFKQKGEKFLPINNVYYDQYDEIDVMKYHILIDEEYSRIYEKYRKRE